MHTPSTHSVRQSVSPDDPARSAVLEAASAPIFETFGETVRVRVEQLDRIGSWVFLRGRMRDIDGGRPNYAATAFAKSAAAGQVSDIYVALLSHSGGAEDDPQRWRIAEHLIGPTDVAWDAWPAKHAAPRSLFGL